jgi:hypothetical protein
MCVLRLGDGEHTHRMAEAVHLREMPGAQAQVERSTLASCHDIRRFCERALLQSHSVYAAQLRLRVACRKKTGARLSTALVRLFSRAIMTSKLSKAQKDSVKAFASITESTCVTYLRAVPTQSTSVSAHALVSSHLSARSTHWKC